MIKNIIFDLGGVILNIDFKKMHSAFEKLGAKNLERFYTRQEQITFIDQFETGKINPEAFRAAIKKELDIKVSDQEFDRAWNSILSDLPTERVDCIKNLKNKYNLNTFLLSNTNSIHIEEIHNKYTKNLFDACFDKQYYSHELGNRKPNPDVFLKILDEHNLKKAETLFVDDTPQHICMANKLGLHTAFIHPGFSILQIESLIKLI